MVRIMILRTKPSHELLNGGSFGVPDHVLQPGVRIREDVKQLVYLNALLEGNMVNPSGAQFNNEVTADDP